MVEWITSPGLTDYDTAIHQMETRAEAIAQGRADEAVWLLEHPPLYTAGTSAQGLRSYMLKIYNYMALALVLTGVTAYGVSSGSRLIFLHLWVVTDDVYRISLSDWKCGEVVPGNSSHV
jgi:hypothetical protein